MNPQDYDSRGQKWRWESVTTRVVEGVVKDFVQGNRILLLDDDGLQHSIYTDPGDHGTIVTWTMLDIAPEPPIKSIVVDGNGEAWQRGHYGWTVALEDGTTRSWKYINDNYGPIDILRRG